MEGALYMDDSYRKEFDATVQNVKDGKYVVLDKTAFYPKGGGQPYDTGKLVRKGDDEEFDVIFVGKFSGQISHEVEQEGLEEGDEVHGVINWERRYRFMRQHTACHVISTLFHERTGAKITGNRIGLEKTRIDFDLDEFDKDKIRRIVKEAEEIMKEGHEVEVSYMEREEAMDEPGMVKLAKALPPAIDELRIVTIGDVDRQADGGTHVANTEEVGDIEILNMKNKGANNRRVYFTVD